MLDLTKWIDARFVLKNKENIVFLAVMFAAVLAALAVYKYQCARTEALREDIAGQEERISLGRELEKLSKEMSQSLALYARGKESLDEAFLRQQASLNGLKVVSLNLEVGKPAGITEEDLFSLELKGGYHNLAKFVSLLENRTRLLRIEGLSLKSPVEFEGEEHLSLNLSGRVSYIKAQ